MNCVRIEFYPQRIHVSRACGTQAHTLYMQCSWLDLITAFRSTLIYIFDTHFRSCCSGYLEFGQWFRNIYALEAARREWMLQFPRRRIWFKSIACSWLWSIISKRKKSNFNNCLSIVFIIIIIHCLKPALLLLAKNCQRLTQWSGNHNHSFIRYAINHNYYYEFMDS